MWDSSISPFAEVSRESQCATEAGSRCCQVSHDLQGQLTQSTPDKSLWWVFLHSPRSCWAGTQHLWSQAPLPRYWEIWAFSLRDRLRASGGLKINPFIYRKLAWVPSYHSSQCTQILGSTLQAGTLQQRASAMYGLHFSLSVFLICLCLSCLPTCHSIYLLILFFQWFLKGSSRKI